MDRVESDNSQHDRSAHTLLEDPLVRRRVAELIEMELRDGSRRKRWARLGPWLTSAASALIVLLAFFIPSVQDQWDRFEGRRVIERYVGLGHEFMEAGKYELAEQAFTRALELSEGRRVDIEEERLRARVQQINSNPNWGVAAADIEEADFHYLLQLEGKGKKVERSATLSCYGAFLAANKRWAEAERVLKEAIVVDPRNAGAHVNLGSLLRDRDRLQEAEASYRTALQIDPGDGRVQYDLGLVLDESGRATEAEQWFQKAREREPNDPDIVRSLATQLEKNGKKQEAGEAFRSLLDLVPDDEEAQAAIRRLPHPAEAGHN